VRSICLLSIVLIAFMSGCRDRSGRENSNRIELGQNVTVSSKALDPVFSDFPRSWRQFISKKPELAIPVTGAAPSQDARSPQPIIIPQCVYSPEARGYVPQVSVSWDESLAPPVEPPSIAARKRQWKEPNHQPEPSVHRFDLGLFHDSFERNLFSSALSTDKLQRFNLPQNSGLVNDQEAVLLTGPGLFPELVDYRASTVRDNSTNREFLKQTVVLRELSQGITNQMRVSHLVGREWNIEQKCVFLVPVCPNRF
jgi:hypothetical protein